jgi:hypothetical protein
MACTVCDVEDPTLFVCFRQNIGMLFLRTTTKIEGELCRPCINMYFRSYTLTTLFLGWWGVPAFVITPAFLVSNVVQYFYALGLPEPRTIDLDARSVTSLNSAPDLLWKFGYGIDILRDPNSVAGNLGSRCSSGVHMESALAVFHHRVKLASWRMTGNAEVYENNKAWPSW